MGSAGRVHPGLHREIARYGAGDPTACMSCGVCTATCALSGEGASFPRRVIHLVQIGHREELARSLEPWLCYFCGDCSASCPRDAQPGEIMMAARRYLTALHDWTGLSRRLYTSPAWLAGAMALVAGAVVAAFALFHGPVITDRVALNAFAPVEWVERGDWIVGGTLALLLLSNAWRMARAVLRAEAVPASLVLRHAWTFAVSFVTQRRWRRCPEQRSRWLTHLVLVSGYLSMMVLVEVGLRWFQTDEVHPPTHWTRVLGYWATAALLFSGGSFLVGRLRRREAASRVSAPTDWAFVGLLLAVALTGILVHVFRLAGQPTATYVTYVVHLAAVAPFLIVQVPFGKWSHMLYRPLALTLAAARDEARTRSRRALDVAA